MNHKAISDKIASLAAEYELAVRQVRTERQAVKDGRRKLRDVQKAQRILQGVAKTVQSAAHSKIAAIVSKCMETVFDHPYKLEIDWIEARGKTEARLKFVDRHGLTIDDPLDETSAGMISVAVFSLRLADLVLSEPRMRKCLLLDEPFSGLASNLRTRTASMVEILAKELGVQFVLTTHDVEFQVGKVIRLQ